MAKQFNPFHHWLGFDENLTHPNHFQLFGVKSNLEDPIGFRKNIHARAKAMLKQLEGMTDEQVGERRKLHTKLRRHIVKAHEILLDDKLRASYLKGLRQKAREAKGSAKPLAVPPPAPAAKGIASNDDQAASQTGKHEGLTMKSKSSKTIKQKSDIDLAEEKSPAIPMAIPLSKPDTLDIPDVTKGEEVNFENLKSEEISIRPGRIKRKKSWLIPILLVIMTLFCVAGIGALVTNFGNMFAQTQNPTPNPTRKQPAALVDGGAFNSESETPATPPTTEEIKKATEELVNATPEAKDVDAEMGSGSGTKQASETTEGETTGSSMAETPAESVNSPAVALTDSKLQSIRFLLSRARKEMVRGRLDSASDQYKTIRSIIGGSLPEQQAAIAKEIKDGRGMIKHLVGFFDQVKLSSKQITGGELEPEPGVIIGFVEGGEDGVVVRMGENVAIPYRSIRPGLAMLLATRKAAPNLPAWRLQEAAYRLVHSNGSNETKAKIEDLVAASESDKYDASAIRGFMDPGNLYSFPEPTKADVAKEELSELTKALVGKQYARVSQLSPAEAFQFGKTFSTAEYEDPAKRIAALNESVKLFVRAGDAFQMVDTIDELDVWTEIDSAMMKADGFVKIASKLPEGSSARWVGEAFFEYLKSADATEVQPQKLKRLKQRMLKLVTFSGLDDLRRLISQTMD